MDNFGFLFAANAVIWTFIVGYIWSISKRTNDLNREIEILKEQATTKKG